MKKIINVSLFLSWSVKLFCVLLPIFEAGYWITNGCNVFPLSRQYEAIGIPHFSIETLPALQKFFGFIISLIPLAFSITALVFLSKLFSAFAKLSFFDKQNVSYLHKAGWALVLGQIAHPLYMALLSLCVTFHNPPGQRNITVGFGTEEFQVLVIGLSILLASWIFQEAVSLREEQEGTV